MMKKGVLFAALIVISAFANDSYAQGVTPRTGTSVSSGTAIGALFQQAPNPLRNYWGDIDGFLNRQFEVTLNLVHESLVRFPPQLPEPLVRRMAMLMLDGIFHYESAPERPPVQEFFHSCMSYAADEMDQTRVSRGALIWKLYDHGFVVRTPTVTVGFDLIRGYSAGAEGFAVADELMARIVDQCDVLFISHRHGDHADSWVARAFLDRSKPVVAPLEVWADSTFHPGITHLTPQAHAIQELSIQNGRRRLEVIIYPGHQGDTIPNNVTLVISPEGMSFCHTGDQSNGDDFGWIDEVGGNHRVDVLLPNCWATDISRMARGFDPELIITGHENELGHSIDHREPFWLTYDRLMRSIYPVVVMTWGESFHYVPR
ncbi:MAG: MBL fold metallo-hydrolase [Candidatus Latescibacteria bacterium]|nr:MBL fold metallo-hydrolase [Candidatus Latescibacterota bacterium]